MIRKKNKGKTKGKKKQKTNEIRVAFKTFRHMQALTQHINYASF